MLRPSHSGLQSAEAEVHRADLFHGGIGQGEPLLHEMDVQHGLDGKRWSSSPTCSHLGAISTATSSQRKTHSNSRLRMRLLNEPNPRLCCFIRNSSQQMRRLTSTGYQDLCKPSSRHVIGHPDSCRRQSLRNRAGRRAGNDRRRPGWRFRSWT